METKISRLRTMMATGDWVGALRMAARFARLGDEKVVITRAWAALTHPDMYRQLGKDPEQLVAGGIAALKRRYPERGAPSSAAPTR